MKKVKNERRRISDSSLFVTLIFVLVFYLLLLLAFLLLLAPHAVNILQQYIYYQIGSDAIVFLFVLLLIIIPAILACLIYLYIKKTRRRTNLVDTISTISKMDNERSYLEQKINELNEKLVASDSNWENAYHLLLTSQSKQITESGIISVSNFLKGFGIDMTETSIQKDLVFVLTPFHTDFDHTYNLIRNVCADIELTAKRGDEEYVSKDVLQHIVKCIVKSRVVIANLDGRNPNVFYELGIAHTLNKPTILLSYRSNSVPFDLQNQYLVLYNDDNELKTKLKEVLHKMLAST